MSKPHYTLHLGDCLESMRAMTDSSVDSIVTDPPYGLSFMGKKWDYDVPSTETWAECLRVLKPGGHLLAFAGTRTQHRMAVRIEDAGFEIRDMIAWVYGSGFPKSRNLDGDWKGWGTALKPALEPITVARKRLIGTVAANVLEHGTGALNIDECRIAHVTIDGGNLALNPHLREHINGGNGGNIISHEEDRRVVTPHTGGRWPANLIHDGSDEVVALFPESTSGSRAAGVRTGMGFHGADGDGGPAIEGSTGSAARFFYCAKTSKADRGEGNIHPTVKPTDLMAYLCRLVTPPGGVVLDPFMGSGSTGKAAMREGFQFIGCEMSPEYMEIARARIEAAAAPKDADQFELL